MLRVYPQNATCLGSSNFAGNKYGENMVNIEVLERSITDLEKVLDGLENRIEATEDEKYLLILNKDLGSKFGMWLNLKAKKLRLFGEL